MKIPAPSFRSSRRTAGFTLLEMMITLGIFILLAAAVFGIITAVLEGASTLQDNQNHHDQVAALNAFLKAKLGGLPAQSSLISYRRGDGDGLTQNGIILQQGDLNIAIDAKMQPNGYYTLRCATFIQQDAQLFAQATAKDDASITWSPLIHDIKTIAWKFQDPNAPQWFDQWNNTAAKPNLVELSLQLAGDLQPATMDFWIPRITPVMLSLPQPSTLPVTNAP